MKALISAVVINALEKELQELTNNPTAHVADYFDLIAGTSAGSILTGIYLCPDEEGNLKYTASDAIQFMAQFGDQVFSSTLGYRIRSMKGLRSSKYQNINFQKILDKYFGDVTLSKINKPCMMPAYNLMIGEPFFFNSISAKKNKNVDFFLRDAILSSCSAPTYFPPVQVTSITGTPYTMVDGGLSSNNPALCAFVEAMKMPRFTAFDQVNIFSVGNISEICSYPYSQAKNWGIVEWALPLIDIFLSSNTTVVDYEMKMLYNSFETRTNYARIEKKVTRKEDCPSMDDTSEKTINKLIEIGNELVKVHKDSIEQFAIKILEQ